MLQSGVLSGVIEGFVAAGGQLFGLFMDSRFIHKTEEIGTVYLFRRVTFILRLLKGTRYQALRSYRSPRRYLFAIVRKMFGSSGNAAVVTLLDFPG